MLQLIKKFQNHSGFRKYSNNFFFLFLEKGIRLFFGFYIGALVIRYLGPQKYGMISYAESIIGFFPVILSLGIEQILVREILNYPEKKNVLLGSFFFLRLFNSLFFVLGISLFLIFFSKDNQTQKIILFLFSLTTILGSFVTLELYFQSQIKNQYRVFLSILSILILSGSRLFLIQKNAGVIYFVILLVLEHFIFAFGFCFFYLKNKNSFLNWKISKQTIIQLFKNSWFFIFSGIFVSLAMRIDQVMIKNILDIKSVGEYAAAVRISEQWYFIPIMLTSLTFPAIINAKKKSQNLYQNRLQKLCDFHLLFFLIFGAIIFLFSNEIIFFLYKNKYTLSGNILKIHILSGIFVFWGVIRAKWVVAENLQKYSILITIIAVFSNILLNFFLIKEYGAIGAAYATVFSSLLAFILPSISYKNLFVFLKITLKSFWNILSLKILTKKYHSKL